MKAEIGRIHPILSIIDFSPVDGDLAPMNARPLDGATRKTRAIFVRAFGSREATLFREVSTPKMMETSSAVFAQHLSHEKAADVGFHFGDWEHDAALVLTLFMFPERFTRGEIRYVTDFVAAGMPYHSAGLATHFGHEGLAHDGIREVKQQKRPAGGTRQRLVRATVSRSKPLTRRA